MDILGIMKNTYGEDEWHYKEGKGMDFHHAILGQEWKGGQDGGAANVGELCNSNRGFAVSAGIDGNYNLGAVVMYDLMVFSHETG
jgi:hypothetical protein